MDNMNSKILYAITQCEEELAGKIGILKNLQT